MDHVRIFKELHSLACLLEDNGKFIEASQITNVMTRIAQTAPAGIGNTPNGVVYNPPNSAGTATTVTDTTPQFTPDQIKKNIMNRMNEMLQLRSMAEEYRKRNSLPNTPIYTIDSQGYKVFVDGQNPIIGQNLTDLANRLAVSVPDANTVKNDKITEKIAQDILSSKYWPDHLGDSSITKAINENYELGYNLLAGTYYIGNKQKPSDVIDRKNINDLKQVFSTLGKYYKENDKKFPQNVATMYVLPKDKNVYQIDDINTIIMDALLKPKGEKFSYIKDGWGDNPNYKALVDGFIQEHNRRNPKNLISLDKPETINQA
jgi:hypothetical protein